MANFKMSGRKFDNSGYQHRFLSVLDYTIKRSNPGMGPPPHTPNKNLIFERKKFVNKHEVFTMEKNWLNLFAPVFELMILFYFLNYVEMTGHYKAFSFVSSPLVSGHTRSLTS